MKKTFVVAAMAAMCVAFVSCGNEASLTERFRTDATRPEEGANARKADMQHRADASRFRQDQEP